MAIKNRLKLVGIARKGNPFHGRDIGKECQIKEKKKAPQINVMLISALRKQLVYIRKDVVLHVAGTSH